jgi:hypothetical protein
MKKPKVGSKNEFTKNLLGSLGMGKPVKPASYKAASAKKAKKFGAK